MARYDTYSAGDDRISEELDNVFVGFNNRLRPDQLTQGVLADSQNGRMNTNGEWQTRKGISNLKAPLAVNDAAATLKCFLINDTAGFASTPNVVSQKLQLTVTQDLSSNFAVDDEGVLFLDTSGLTGISLVTANYKVKVISVNSTTIVFEVLDQTFSSGTAGGNVQVESVKLDDLAINKIFGSCKFSDPNAESQNYILLAANTKVVAVRVSDPTQTFDITYASGEVVANPVDVIQAFNKLYLFRDGDTALSIDLAVNNLTTDQTAEVNAGSFVVGKTYKISTSEGGADFTDCGATDSVVGTVFVATNDGSGVGGTAKATEYLEMKKVASGDFTFPVPLTVTDLDYADGLGTATVSSTATLKAGDQLTINLAQTSGYNNGDKITVKGVSSPTKFTFVATQADATNKTMVVQVKKYLLH